MPKTRDITDALRVAALWLLVVSVFLGPAGLGGAAAFASASKTCGVSCPCDEAVHDDPAGEPPPQEEEEEEEEEEQHAEADPCDDDREADSGHEDGDPCQDECPDDCPNCGCCLGIAMAVLPLPMIPGAASCTHARMLAPVGSPASGACTDVFRPPRSLT